MRSHRLTWTLLLVALNIQAVPAQRLMRQTNITRMGVPYGHYSGITHVSDSLYAVVSDKDEADGFHFLHVRMDTVTGRILGVSRHEPSRYGENLERASAVKSPQRDLEGIAYYPPSNSFFISGEADQRILEYSFDGLPTGRELSVPAEFVKDHIQDNLGFESLTYNDSTRLFWTTTEGPLKADMDGTPLLRRLQSFTADLQPSRQYLYEMDRPLKKKRYRTFVHGVSDMLAMDDGSLLVMEREALITPRYVGSYCIVKLYRVVPDTTAVPSGAVSVVSTTTPLPKHLICQFRTSLKVGKMNFANYEGLCPGPRLSNGRQTVLLINDSQNGQGNRLYRAKDYIKVIIL